MPNIYVEVGGVLLTAFLMYKQNSHLAEANRIMREHHGIALPANASRWKRIRFYWPLIAMGIFVIVSWIPYFLTPGKDVLVNYGINGGRIFAQVDTQNVSKSDRLFMIARVADDSIDFKTNTTVARSATFPITTPFTNMELTISKEFAQRSQQRLAMIGIYIYEVPEEFPFESVRTISDAEKRGARHLADKAFGPIMLTLSPTLPPQPGR